MGESEDVGRRNSEGGVGRAEGGRERREKERENVTTTAMPRRVNLTGAIFKEGLLHGYDHTL